MTQYRHTAIKVLENQGWFLLFLILISPITNYRGISRDNPLPDIHMYFIHAAITTFMLSLLFYYIHRLLHFPYFYKSLHKIHHEWQAPVACSAIYGHPIDHIFNNVIPILVPTIILGLHPYELYVFIAIVTVHSVNVHSGYNFLVWLTKDHDDHHKYFLCNYGAGLDWFDRFHGTRYIDLVRK